MPVVEAHLEYKRSSRFDDELVVETRLGATSRVTVRFDYRVLRGAELLVLGHTLLACVDDSHKPRRIPEDIARMLMAAETA
jgi:acyl-CoA thioester hydrolase